MYHIVLLVIVIIFLLCSFDSKENFYSHCECSKCKGKFVKNGLCFDKKNECEKTCSAIYDKVGVKRKVIHKCKADLDGTYICSTPDWFDKYVR